MRKIPLGLTLAVAIGMGLLAALGTWQLHRLAWKQDLLARIAASQRSGPRPIEAVLAAARRGEDVGFMRVAATCGPAVATSAPAYRYAVRDGAVAWRLMGVCPLTGAAYGAIALDRGLVDRFAGQMAPRAAPFAAPAAVVGVLRAPGGHWPVDPAPAHQADGSLVVHAVDGATLKTLAGPGAAPYYLAVESETPPLPGVRPAALPQDIPNNHLVYALTWFGLAGVLLWTFIAYVWRRMGEA
ncbi:MAG TPA: SURF1 family cytochrome oxidase biogenesis protein [Caulobacteraceae bacterium]|nr:SURF1 family cytochrome oxidase biogenesis protein [Caulobacteraceae bacterium]